MTKSGGGAAAALDAQGWPTEDFKVILWHGISRMNGTYALSFNGQATVRAGFGDCVVSAVTYDATTNTSRASLTYRSTDGAGLELTFTNSRRTAASATNSGVTNVKCMRPVTAGSSTSYPTSKLFTDQFGDVMWMFRGARFMDFTATNGKLAEDRWSERVLPTHPSQSPDADTDGYGWQGKGSAWEYVVLIANEFDVDPWICVPVAADADYITKLAQLFKFGSDGIHPYTSAQANPVWPPLKPGRALYVEYANELWNFAGAFSQSGWNRDQAAAEAAAEQILDYDGDQNEYYWAWRRVGKRTVEISNIFRSVFGDAAMMTTVRPVLEWQQGNGQATATQAFGFLDGYYNNGRGRFVATPHPVSYYIYGGSGSAYYGPDNGSDALTLNNIWTNGSNDLDNWAPDQTLDASFAAAFGLKRLAYEGGPSMDNLGHSESVKEQAWNDPRMKRSVIEHHDFWEAHSGDELFYFYLGGEDHEGYYQWNMVRDLFDPLNTSPKLQAIADLAPAAKHPTTLGTPAPATLDANRWSLISRGWGSPGAGTLTLSANPGDNSIGWASYNFLTTSKTSRQVVVAFGGNGTLDVYLNDVLVDRMIVSGSGTHTSAALAVAADLHGVRLACTSGSVTVSTVRLQ
jgi:hypothetical protein